MGTNYLIDGDILTNIADAIRTQKGETASVLYYPQDMPQGVLSISGGGGGGGSGINIYMGTDEPANSFGNNEDIYLKTSNLIGINFTGGIVQLDYYMNRNTELEFDCAYIGTANSYDTPIGSRDGSIDHFIAWDGGNIRLVWAGYSANNLFDLTNYLNTRLKIVINRNIFQVWQGNTKLTESALSGGQATSVVKIGLFSLFTDNGGGDFSSCRTQGEFYGLKIYEYDEQTNAKTLVKDYIPMYFNNNIIGIKDRIDDTSFMISGSSYSSITDLLNNQYVNKCFIKINSVWQPVLGVAANDIPDGTVVPSQS